MPVTFDARKSGRNAELRGVPFEMAEQFDCETATTRVNEELRRVAARLKESA